MERASREWTEAWMLDLRGKTLHAAEVRTLAERSYVYALESLLMWVRA